MQKTVDICGIRCYIGPGQIPYVSVSAGLNELYPMSPYIKPHHLEAGETFHLWMARYLGAIQNNDYLFQSRLFGEAPDRVKRAYDWAEENIDWVDAVEETCFHPMGIACTRDFRGGYKKEHELMDWKFSDKSSDRYRMQIGIYRLFDPAPDNASLVLISKEGKIRRYVQGKEPGAVARFIKATLPLIKRVRDGYEMPKV